jgi:catechol 2,3-dioxygenase-like lactoylglutathione lyase family enzyme
MQLRGVHHVSLNVSDAEKAERFYVDVLGLEKLHRPDLGFPGSWLACADGRQVHLLQVDGWTAPKGQHFAFAVNDLDAARQDLQAKGVKVSEPNGIPGTGRQSFFKDPSGNLIEINEPVGG